MDLSNGESYESSPTMKNAFLSVAQALDLFDSGNLSSSDMYQQYLNSRTFLMVRSVIHSIKTIVLQQHLTAEI